MEKQRINLQDNIMDVVSKMSEGNSVAMRVLMEILTSNAFDIDNALGGMGIILLLDTFGIYGTDIYILNNDICDGNIVRTVTVLRATQLGLFDSSILQDACHRQDRSGKELIPINRLYEEVKKRLPNFDSKGAFN